MASVVRVEGLSDLGRRMQGLSADINRKIARAATNAGAQVLKKAAADRAPMDTGNLKKNVIVKRLPPNETDLTSAHVVTIRKGRRTKKQKEAGIRDAYYGQFLEFGTVKMAAQPFLRPALDEKGFDAIEAVRKRLLQRIDRAERTGK